MYIHEQRCLSLGIIQKEAGEFNGKPTNGYTALCYVAFDENSSRRAYLNDATLISQAFQYCSNWGAEFLVSGCISDKGSLAIDLIEPVDTRILGGI